MNTDFIVPHVDKYSLKTTPRENKTRDSLKGVGNRRTPIKTSIKKHILHQSSVILSAAIRKVSDESEILYFDQNDRI